MCRRERNLCVDGVVRYVICRLAGVRLSRAPESPFTLTMTLTGLRRPTRTSWSTASLTLALNSPVRLCLGRQRNIFCSSSLNPRSNSRSPSSRTSISNDDWGQWTCGDIRSSSRRPGVETIRLGERLRNVLRSSAGDVDPPSRSCGTTLRVEDFWRGASPSSGGFIAAAEGGWNSSKESNTLYICDASSLGCISAISAIESLDYIIPRWRNNNRTDMVLLNWFFQAQELLHDRNQKRQRLPTACDGFHHDILVAHKQRDGRCLHGSHAGETHGGHRIENPLRQGRGYRVPRSGGHAGWC